MDELILIIFGMCIVCVGGAIVGLLCLLKGLVKELIDYHEDQMDLELAAKALKRNEFIDWEDLKDELNL